MPELVRMKVGAKLFSEPAALSTEVIKKIGKRRRRNVAVLHRSKADSRWSLHSQLS
jgi:predicted CopG family antitoxin